VSVEGCKEAVLSALRTEKYDSHGKTAVEVMEETGLTFSTVDTCLTLLQMGGEVISRTCNGETHWRKKDMVKKNDDGGCGVTCGRCGRTFTHLKKHERFCRGNPEPEPVGKEVEDELTDMAPCNSPPISREDADLTERLSHATPRGPLVPPAPVNEIKDRATAERIVKSVCEAFQLSHPEVARGVEITISEDDVDALFFDLRLLAKRAEELGLNARVRYEREYDGELEMFAQFTWETRD